MCMAPSSSSSIQTTPVRKSPTTLPRSQRISLYNPSLRPLLRCRSLRQLLQIQAHLTVSSLLKTSPFAVSRLLKTSLSFSLPYSLLLFLHLPSPPDLFTLNLLLPHLPISHYFPSSPNSFTFTSLLSSCRNLTLGETLHAQAIKRGFVTYECVANCLISCYAACGVVTDARQVFDEMENRDLVSWNAMVDGYVKVGDLERAREVFDGMGTRNVVSWNVMVGGYLKGRRTEMGLGLVRKLMMEEGRNVKASLRTLVNAVMGCGRIARGREGRSVHGNFVRNFDGKEEEGGLIFGTALLDMYGKCGRVEDARRVFDGLKGRNLVCWNAMILGYCVHGDPRDGIALLEEMIGEGENSTRITPDEVTFVGVLSACARGGFLEKGKKYFEQMKSLYKLTPTFAHHWCMANLYGGLGLIQEAEEVLKCMPEEKESLVWSGLLGYCRFRGDIDLGERIGKQLIELEPFNGSRYALLWNVYMAAGRWEDAQNVKGVMQERGIRTLPNGRLVDLNEIVHNFKVGDRSKPEIEKICAMMDDLAVMLKLPGVAENSNESKQQ